MTRKCINIFCNSIWSSKSGKKEVPAQVDKTRAELAGLNHCAVHFLSRAAASLCWYYCYIYNLPKTKKFGCVGRGDLTSLFFSKVVKY